MPLDGGSSKAVQDSTTSKIAVAEALRKAFFETTRHFVPSGAQTSKDAIVASGREDRASQIDSRTRDIAVRRARAGCNHIAGTESLPQLNPNQAPTPASEARSAR